MGYFMGSEHLQPRHCLPGEAEASGEGEASSPSFLCPRMGSLAIAPWQVAMLHLVSPLFPEAVMGLAISSKDGSQSSVHTSA